MQNNILVAKDGFIYTNGDTYAYTIRLGVNDSADNWYEITEAEYEKRMAEENPEPQNVG